jgi:hypothetical protein
MALWLAAVIVLIAVGLMPSGAQAHAGHPHASARITATMPTGMAGAQAESEARPRVLAALTGKAMVTSPCDGACCNAGCRTSCCTGAGLAPESADPSGPRGPGDPALARALPARTDVVPEALPEPPRFDA